MSQGQTLDSPLTNNLHGLKDGSNTDSFKDSQEYDITSQVRNNQNNEIPNEENNQNPPVSLGEFIEEEESNDYDPMVFMIDTQMPENDNKRPKLDEDEEFEIDSNDPVYPQTTPMMMELNDFNSVKLKKGNLVVRRCKEGTEELNEMQNTQGTSIIDVQTKGQKSVRYHPEQNLEYVKYFQKDAEPCAPPLTIEEVERIQKELENAKTEEIKVASSLSKELERKDGINKDRKRALENMKKVQEYIPNSL